MENGYRIFTDIHLEQVKFARVALQIEVLQNGLRKQVITIIKTSASGDFKRALALTAQYLDQLRQAQMDAEEAITIVERILAEEPETGDESLMTRKEAASYLHVTIDTLRNWEMNGLITIKRKQNGYRVYDADDLNRLKIIRSLRCANYSLASILRMLNGFSANSEGDLRKIIDTPRESEFIISVCDKLLTSLGKAQENAAWMMKQIALMELLSKAEA
jgi:DNA-binding transcriptional MerR regulator